MIAIGKWIGPPHLAALFLAALYHFGFSSNMWHKLSGLAGGVLAQALSKAKASNKPCNLNLTENTFLPLLDDAD
jgi:hypothetical protein